MPNDNYKRRIIMKIECITQFGDIPAGSVATVKNDNARFEADGTTHILPVATCRKFDEFFKVTTPAKKHRGKK